MITSLALLFVFWLTSLQNFTQPATSQTPLSGSEQLIGGAVALLLLKEVFGFVRFFLQKQGIGDRRRDIGEEYKIIFMEVLAAAVIPILNQQVEILAQLRATQLTNGDRMLKLQYTADESKEAMAAARASLHKLHDGVQALPGAVVQLQRAHGGRG